MNDKKSPALPILTGIMLFLYAGLNIFSFVATVVPYFGSGDFLSILRTILIYVLPIILVIVFGVCALKANKYKKILVPVLAYALILLLTTFIIPVVFSLIQYGTIKPYLTWDFLTGFALILLAVIFMFIQNPFGKEDGQASQKAPKEKKNKKGDAPTVTPEELQEAEELYAAGVLSDEEIEDMRNKAAS